MLFKVDTNYRAHNLFIFCVAFALFLILGASLTDATILCTICFVYGNATTAIGKSSGKSENPKSVLYVATYFGILMAVVLLMHSLIPDSNITLWAIAFSVGLFVAQFLAQCLFGLRAKENSM